LSCNLKAGTEVDPSWLPLLATMKKFKLTSWVVRRVKKKHTTPDSHHNPNRYEFLPGECNCTRARTGTETDPCQFPICIRLESCWRRSLRDRNVQHIFKIA
jgi:hypothetical protein